jgi:rhodanese-related sulfurtransferase
LFGHTKVKVLNGGRDKWKAEGRPSTRETLKYSRTDYPVPPKRFDAEIRAFAEDALKQSKAGKPLIDVRSPGEFKGDITHMPEYPQEGVLRGGHIPGAKSVPWKTAANDDGTLNLRASWRGFTCRIAASRRQRDDRLLPHRGALEPHVVCAHVPARHRTTCGTTTAPGLNGAIASACRSSAAARLDFRDEQLSAELSNIINLFETLPKWSVAKRCVSYADSAKKQEPREGEKFALEDVRKDEECADTVGVYLHVDGQARRTSA